MWPLLFGPSGKVISRSADASIFLACEGLHIGDRLGNARLELGDCLLVVLILGRVCVGEPCASVLGLVAGALHLAGECEHVGEESRDEQHRRIDPLCFGIRLGLVENSRERVEADLECWD